MAMGHSRGGSLAEAGTKVVGVTAMAARFCVEGVSPSSSTWRQLWEQ